MWVASSLGGAVSLLMPHVWYKTSRRGDVEGHAQSIADHSERIKVGWGRIQVLTPRLHGRAHGQSGNTVIVKWVSSTLLPAGHPMQL